MLREDGSVESSNNPSLQNRYLLRDYGLYRGVVRDVIYTDDKRNDSGGSTPNEVVYDLMVVGGERDGQLFYHARVMKGLGGFSNTEEVILKKLEGLSKSDPTSTKAAGEAVIRNVATYNGDVVYFQFLNGDLHMPIITGMGHHQKASVEATADDGQRAIKVFNGISTEITKDGEFAWTKANGAEVPVGENPEDPAYNYINQFTPIIGQEEAVKVTLGNKYDFKFEMLPGLNIVIDGTKDKFEFVTTLGTSVKINGGTTDSVELGTTLGTSLKVVGGASDSLTLEAQTGATLKVDGSVDSISLDVAFGDSLSVSAKDGIQASTPTGTSLSMKNGTVALGSGGQATFSLGKDGFIKLGNAVGGDVLKDVLQELLLALTIETPAGFGAPLSQVAKYVELLTKIMLITGG